MILRSPTENENRPSTRLTCLHVVSLIGLCSVLYFPYLGSIPFFDKGEPREALAVQDIVQRGEWLVPLKRGSDVPSKPPLMHWTAALVIKMTGSLSEATIRFPSAFYATLGVLLIYWLGRQIFGREEALLGAAILATTMIYQDQALDARVDMTLCFFVTAGLVLFYSIYRGYLRRPSWFYVFYFVVGVGTLAKGPLGLVLPGLVAGSTALIERRWDIVRRLCLHPGVALTILLATGWYVVAVTRGSEEFFDRQILQENLSRFVGGSGHSHPIYYYISYLFSQSLPWGLFLPFLLWDVFKARLGSGNGALFLKLWFVVIFAFFSISVGKRPVYLLPLYPSLALLLGAWFCSVPPAGESRISMYRGIAAIAVLAFTVLLLVSLGQANWFFSFIEGMLKPHDRDNLMAVRNQLDGLGWTFTLVSLSTALAWLSVSCSLWRGKIRLVAYQLVAVSVLHAVVVFGMVKPLVAANKSYRDFMSEVNRRVRPDDRLYLYGAFNSDAVVFYRGKVIEYWDPPTIESASRLGQGDGYLIMPEQSWKEMRKAAKGSAPLSVSTGTGPQGDARLVLLRADVP